MTKTVFIDPPLSLALIAREAAFGLWHRRYALTKSLAIPVAMLFSLNLLILLTGLSTIGWLITICAFSVALALMSLAVIHTLDPNITSGGWFGASYFARRGTRFFGYWHLLSIPGVACVYVVVTLFQTLIAAVFALLVLSWFASRLVLVYPAAASDNPHPVSWAWQVSERHQELLFALVLGFLTVQTSALLALAFSALPALGLLLANTLVQCVLTISFNALLCQTYQHLTARHGPTTPAPPAPEPHLLEQPSWRF